MPVLPLDEKLDRARVQQFASQVECLHPNLRHQLGESFGGSESIEFLEGLLSAYANMHVMVQNVPPEQLKEYTGPVVATVAERLEKKYNERELSS